MGSRKPKPSRVTELMVKPREIAAADFKARCREIMREVECLGKEVVILKQGKPVARLVPVQYGSAAFCGSLKGMVLEEHDLISPVNVKWEAQS
jgi:prevent-host-death family protein